MKSFGFQKQLCSLCLDPFSPLRLKKIGRQSICPLCFKLITKKNIQPESIQSLPQEKNDLEASDVIQQQENAEGLLGTTRTEVLSGLKSFTPVFIAIILSRAVLYLGTSFVLDTNSELYAVINGIMLGDLSTWLLFGIIQLPFAGDGVVYEFAIYGGITAYLGSAGKIVMLTPPTGETIGIACLAFILTGFIKSTIWALKTFDLIYK